MNESLEALNKEEQEYDDWSLQLSGEAIVN